MAIKIMARRKAPKRVREDDPVMTVNRDDLKIYKYDDKDVTVVEIGSIFQEGFNLDQKKPAKPDPKGEGKAKGEGKPDGGKTGGHKAGKASKAGKTGKTEKKKPDKKLKKKELLLDVNSSKPQTGLTSTQHQVRPLPAVRSAVPLTISLTPKKGHPLEKSIQGDYCYTVNKIPGGTLTLKRNEKYLVKIVGKSNMEHELIFTQNDVGGRNSRGLTGLDSVPQGQERLFILNASCPQKFYYQDKHVERMGGTVLIE